MNSAKASKAAESGGPCARSSLMRCGTADRSSFRTGNGGRLRLSTGKHSYGCEVLDRYVTARPRASPLVHRHPLARLTLGCEGRLVPLEHRDEIPCVPVSPGMACITPFQTPQLERLLLPCLCPESTVYRVQAIETSEDVKGVHHRSPPAKKKGGGAPTAQSCATDLLSESNRAALCSRQGSSPTRPFEVSPIAETGPTGKNF